MSRRVQQNPPVIAQLHFGKLRPAGQCVLYPLLHIVHIEIQMEHLLLGSGGRGPDRPLVVFDLLKYQRQSFSLVA